MKEHHQIIRLKDDIELDVSLWYEFKKGETKPLIFYRNISLYINNIGTDITYLLTEQQKEVIKRELEIY